MSRYARRQWSRVAARSAGARSASLDAAKAISDLCDKITVAHSITSSARPSTDDGISRPSALAVVRFMTNRTSSAGCIPTSSVSRHCSRFCGLDESRRGPEAGASVGAEVLFQRRRGDARP
jgi:hypothetical protein